MPVSARTNRCPGKPGAAHSQQATLKERGPVRILPVLLEDGPQLPDGLLTGASRYASSGDLICVQTHLPHAWSGLGVDGLGLGPGLGSGQCGPLESGPDSSDRGSNARIRRIEAKRPCGVSSAAPFSLVTQIHGAWHPATRRVADHSPRPGSRRRFPARSTVSARMIGTKHAHSRRALLQPTSLSPSGPSRGGRAARTAMKASRASPCRAAGRSAAAVAGAGRLPTPQGADPAAATSVAAASPPARALPIRERAAASASAATASFVRTRKRGADPLTAPQAAARAETVSTTCRSAPPIRFVQTYPRVLPLQFAPRTSVISRPLNH